MVDRRGDLGDFGNFFAVVAKDGDRDAGMAENFIAEVGAVIPSSSAQTRTCGVVEHQASAERSGVNQDHELGGIGHDWGRLDVGTVNASLTREQ